MRATVFCILCLIIGIIISTNTDHQMQQDLQKIDHHTYTM